jgi:putative tricarboxylic transport membrane protein
MGLNEIMLGFEVALRPDALMVCFIGVVVGTFIGVLPGIGPLAAISMALPVTFHMEPTLSLIMLAGIFYGAQYGGSTASILLNLPGTASAAVVCLDGYPMTRQGRAGVALFVAAIASFIGSSLAILLVMGFAPSLAGFALRFTSVEYFAVMFLALVVASTVSQGSPAKGLAMVVVGLVLGVVGTDVNSGHFRFTLGMMELADGISLIAVAMGLFGVSEVISSIDRTRVRQAAGSINLRSMLPTRDEMRRFWWPVLRGSGVGAIVGILPGTGPSVASFMSYAVEKRVAKDPERFGNGAIEGVAGPEAANNAAVQSAFIPTLSLGIPGDVVMALILSAMIIHGVTPGPMFVVNQPEMFWGLVASFWIGNILLLILNVPLIGIWVRMLTIPYSILYPAILFFICVGAYSVSGNVFAIWLTLFFGVVGYVMNVYGYPASPLILGLILGPMMEENFRRALLVSRGDFTVFLTRPISAVLLGLAVLAIVWTLLSAWRRSRARGAAADSAT